MATWQPQEQGLGELIQLLRESQSIQHDVQVHIADRLEQLSQLPDYANNLVYILIRMESEDVKVRTVAGLILKNHLSRTGDQIAPGSIDYVKSVIIPGLRLQDDVLRRTVTQVISMIMAILLPQNWLEGLSQLMQLLDSSDTTEAEGAYSTFAKICEDIPKALEACEVNGTQPLQHLTLKLLEATGHPDKRIRMHALNCLNQFVQIGTSPLQQHMDAFIKALFASATDGEATIRRFVCQALVLILGARPEKLMPEINNVVDYMLFSTEEQDEEVALEACEFWLQFAEDPQIAPNLRPFLDRVAPVLLKCMIYTDIDLLMLGGDEDDAAVPDRPEDIKPQHYGGKDHRNERAEDAANGEAGPSTNKQSRAGIEAAENDDEDDDDDDDYYDDDEDDEDEGIGEWNLRKCSAAALDVMALQFNQDLLEILLPLLKERLFSEDWIQRESGILALGAIADGCISGVQPHLPTLIPLLVNTLKDPKPLVRSIACWTLSRYSSWCTAIKTPEHQQAYFLPTMEGLLRMVLDNNKRVQEAGCSAFATLEEEAGTDLAQFLQPVLQTLVFAFDKYQQKNLLILYDAIGTLADSVGASLNEPQYVQTIMPPLINKWQSLTDDDIDLVPLFECLSSVTIAIGPGFLEYSPPVFQRCLQIIHNTLSDFQQESQKPLQDQDLPDRTFIIVSLDLLSGLTQGLGTNIRSLIAQSQPPLLPLLAMCITHPDPPVRQSGYALLGDLAISAFDLLRPTLPQIMPELVNQIETEPKPDTVCVCNNASWSAGEIALQFGNLSTNNGSGTNGSTNPSPRQELEQWVNPLINRLIPVLLNQKSMKSLSENAAVTIGRLGLVVPDMVAPHLEVFLESWCQALWDIKDNDEKDSAFRGLCEMIQVNPNGAAKGFVYFCNAVVRWTTPSQQLNDMFAKILSGFREMSGAQWDVQKASFPPIIAQRLADRYGL
ncbi:hypothetical protein L7F22_039181 [Adiantum nelumboides]|nr:hypothetical protein [Adiantum nelumboides]